MASRRTIGHVLQPSAPGCPSREPRQPRWKRSHWLLPKFSFPRCKLTYLMISVLAADLPFNEVCRLLLTWYPWPRYLSSSTFEYVRQPPYHFGAQSNWFHVEKSHTAEPQPASAWVVTPGGPGENRGLVSSKLSHTPRPSMKGPHSPPWPPGAICLQVTGSAC